MELKSHKHRNAYQLITNDVLRQLDYNAGMSARRPLRSKIYAELKRKICPDCKLEKSVSEFHVSKTKANGLNSYCKDCYYKKRNADKLKNPEKYRVYEFKRSLRRYYGITIEQYNKMFEDQKGCCLICGLHQKDMINALAVDHDKETGQVRALLCARCNPGIGFFKHDKDLLVKAIAYLEKFKK